MIGFDLIPFPAAAGQWPGISVSGEAGRSGSILAVDFFLTGAVNSLKIARPAGAPTRKDKLWKTTCFECFLGSNDRPEYHECNVSPAGDWNVYRFCGYRQGMMPEERSTPPTVLLQFRDDCIYLDLRLDLANIANIDAPLTLGMAAVLETCFGDLSYWAMHHGGDRPDFHRRDNFLLNL
jgi:hypothetical protein